MIQAGLEFLHVSTQWANVYRVGGGMERDTLPQIHYPQSTSFLGEEKRDLFSNTQEL